MRKYISRKLSYEKKRYNQPLNEGIGINYENDTISYKSAYEYNSDTSVDSNPTFSDEYGYGNNVRVYSIFKRMKDTIDDGDPLLYALMGEQTPKHNKQKWHFKTNKDKNAIHQQIGLITAKFLHLYKAGFTILLPSSNGLSRYIADLMSLKSKDILIIDDILVKVTTIEALDAAMEPDSLFKKHYKGHVEEKLRELKGCLSRMDNEHSGYFTRHLVPNLEMRDVLVSTIKASETAEFKYKKELDGRDVLLIDDPIHAGQSVKDAISVLNTLYDTKSITVLTLFSKLYSGKEND